MRCVIANKSIKDKRENLSVRNEEKRKVLLPELKHLGAIKLLLRPGI